jgi:hypothetical protein
LQPASSTTGSVAEPTLRGAHAQPGEPAGARSRRSFDDHRHALATTHAHGFESELSVVELK